MKHAGAEALDQLDHLLVLLRNIPGLRERSRAVFYLKSKPFLHFHCDPAGLFADLRCTAEFQRYPVTSAAEQAALLKAVAKHLKEVDRP